MFTSVAAEANGGRKEGREAGREGGREGGSEREGGRERREEEGRERREEGGRGQRREGREGREERIEKRGREGQRKWEWDGVISKNKIAGTVMSKAVQCTCAKVSQKSTYP